MKTNIALMGFMGTGKTAVGKALAEKLGKEFIELDSLIVQRAGKSIPEIFKQDGGIAFRELEIDAIREVSARRNIIIACGGGIVLNWINVERLKKESLIVCLTASSSVTLKRISSDTNRPLLNVSDQALRIKELLKFRKPFYERAADIKINTSKMDIESVVEQIVDRIKEL